MADTTPRLRFAPSPTGYLHVGGGRTALFNWLYAKKFGGQFLLRIEDTDKARSTDDSTRAIFEGLGWLGLAWDEDVVFQGANVERHRADAVRMLAEGTAYRCFCTQEELAERRAAAELMKTTFRYDGRCDRLPRAEVEQRVASGEPFTIRFRVPDGSTAWADLVHETITFPHKDLDDFIILRADGTPIYNLAVVSDDIASRITLVMRGDDHISNTPKQILLYNALGAPLPTFAHLPMIHGADGKKLSKRHGATAVGDYEHLGIVAPAMRNFLALLGWAPGGDIEIMNTEQMISLFDPSGLQRKAAIFDTKKLEWMNGQYLSAMPASELRTLMTPYLAQANVDVEGVSDAWFEQLTDLLKVRARTVDDLVKQAIPYFGETIEYDPAAVAKQWKDVDASRNMIASVRSALQGTGVWTAAEIEGIVRDVASSLGLSESAGKLFQPLRVALTGSAASPGLFEVMELIGRERTFARLDSALVRLSGISR